MKRLLMGHALQRSIGLLVGAREVTMSVLASTPLGRLELARESEPRGPMPLDEQLGRLLEPWLELRPRLKVVLGVPEVKVFHSARPVTSTNRKAPELWLHDALQTQGVRIEEMVIDVVEARVGRKALAGLVSCRRKALAEPLEALAARSARLVRIEPTPCALLRGAADRLRTPRGSKLAARFVLGDRQAMGMLVAGGLPLHWRVFDLTPGDEPSALLSALMALRMLARGWQAGTDIDAVQIHGRPDLAARLDPAELASTIGARVARADGPGFDPTSIAAGLALGGLVEEGGFDLGRTIRPPDSIREIFPWGELAMQSALLGGVLLLTGDRAHTLDASHASARASLARFAWLGDRQEADLIKEKAALEQKTRTAGAFLASRVLWSDHLRDVASHLPANTRLTSLQGSGELENPGGKATSTARRAFVMRLETPVPPSGKAPAEVDGLLESLRDRSHVGRDFPVIELKDIKTTRVQAKGAQAQNQGQATFSIVCLPKTASRPAASTGR